MADILRRLMLRNIRASDACFQCFGKLELELCQQARAAAESVCVKMRKTKHKNSNKTKQNKQNKTPQNKSYKTKTKHNPHTTLV